MTVPGRTLVCTVCFEPVRVLEAAQGAKTETEHRWIVPREYVCGWCLNPAIVDEGAV